MLRASYEDSLRIYVRCRLGRFDTAEDLLQETWCAVLQALAGFNQTSSPKTWLFRIARNKCADFWRRLQVAEPVNESALRAVAGSVSTPSTKLRAIEQNNELEHVLAQLRQRFRDLSAEDRELLIFKYCLDVEYREIAEIRALGESEEQLRTRVKRLKQRLTRVLKNGPVI